MMQSILDMSLNIWGRLPTFKTLTHNSIITIMEITLKISIKHQRIISIIHFFVFTCFQKPKLREFLP